ncbi:two-component system response regulator CssR [Pullulanibacillus pueri]|uniref:DNA-binding response regulator n=1 Tax=Pullulanibacillus pueri TaxID=1437324 RepID=A0A8J2ZZ91_9BACL|nr:response regulator transcription factor [Pullulanibacillus pueri]MBM7683421.1 two-component system response regulator CssR [Pullulanibacillus pueri]GGH88078.1 DNA-binding response regulator [Pullulanibacillus pueri]
MADFSFHIHLVEDEERLSSILKVYLEKEGWKVTVFNNAEDALNYIHDGVHLWILDIMLPGISGFDLIKKIKENNSEQPVIFISARDRDLDKIQGLEMGSDDYLTKPFLPKELVIRTKKLLHRIYGQGLKSHLIEVSGYKFDINRRKVFDKEMQEIDLTMKEFDVVLFLLENINVAKQREEILTTVWGESYVGSTRAVDDVIRRVRKKLPRLNLETLYGAGYRIVS